MHIDYVETPRWEVLRRNEARAERVPDSVIARLAMRLQASDLTEAHGMELVDNSAAKESMR